jgi:hypothetical protein
VFAHARTARNAPPFGTAAAERAVADAWLAKQRPDRALGALVRSEEQAQRYGQRVDLALAQHARGKLLGGDEGQSLSEAAHQALLDAGASVRLIDRPF